MIDYLTLPGTLPSPALPSPALPASNQGTRTLTRATTDAEAVSGWLAKYLDNEHTFISYRKEADRLLRWLEWRELTLAGMTVEDVTAYRMFLNDPLPRDKWCLQQESRTLADGSPNPAWKPMQRVARSLPDGSPNPEWRPFVSGLSERVVQQAMTVLFGLFEYLAGIGYLAANPLRASRRRSPALPHEVERYLEQDAWQGLKEHIEQLPKTSPRECAHYQRVKFAVTMLYLTGLRREEFVNARWCDLVLRRGNWWLKVLGKGNKQGEAPINQDAIEAIKTYRASLGLPAWPASDDVSPLLRNITGQRGISVKSLHHLLIQVFRSSSDPRVQKASAHWLRHTAATHMLEAGLSLTTVRDNLRHSNISTTSRYAHADKDKRHEDTEKHRVG